MLQIIQLMPEEWQAYRIIRLESLLQEPQAFTTRYEDALTSPDSYWQGRLRETLNSDTSWLLFARQDDHLVGMIGAFRKPGSDTARIISVYVSKGQRGQGIGARLMEAILAELSKHSDIRKASLGVNQSQTAAVALYRRYGFVTVGEQDTLHSDGTISPGFEMEKWLPRE